MATSPELARICFILARDHRELVAAAMDGAGQEKSCTEHAPLLLVV